MQEKGEKVNSSESSNTHQYFTETYLQYNSLCLCFSPSLVSQASRHAYAHTVSPNERDVKVHRHKHKLNFLKKKPFNLVSRLSKLPRYWIEKVPLTAATAVRMFVICAHREWGGKKRRRSLKQRAEEHRQLKAVQWWSACFEWHSLNIINVTYLRLLHLTDGFSVCSSDFEHK